LKLELALINSRLLDWVFHQYSESLSLAGGYLRIGVPQVSELPAIDLESIARSRATPLYRIVVLVEQMLALHADPEKAKTGHAQTVIQRQIEATDRQIDQLVYQLYGLTDAEIALVEASAT
jgi:hypothetical protein